MRVGVTSQWDVLLEGYLWQMSTRSTFDNQVQKIHYFAPQFQGNVLKHPLNSEIIFGNTC